MASDWGPTLGVLAGLLSRGGMVTSTLALARTAIAHHARLG